jgi:hypothetical protein
MTIPVQIDFGVLRLNLPYDANNNLATISYTPSGGLAQTETVDLEYAFPYMRMIFDVAESLGTEQQAAALTGYTNSATWRTYAPRTCLCLCVKGVPLGTNYENRYWIGYRSQTWDVYKVFRNVDGSIPTGIAASLVTDGSATAGNGWGRFIMFPSVDFNTKIPNVT